ncbi:MFS transporter [Phenylobacterium sp. 20VBR1]|uniref:MFS transporter n=1 Tax=Phenylobacterium glaciei TaxID=2803784 RepID=A0A941D459_9CAUL|nr:MFS transporter [Phenylobacterium glaciei]
MAFLRNKTVNRLNLHYGMHALAMSGGGVFFAVFLMDAGLPPAMVLAAIALILGGRFCLRPLVLPLAKRFGLKGVMIGGTLATALQYPILAQVHGLGPMLLVLCLVSAIGDTLYWTSYHAYFAALGDAEHRGHQIGAREALASVVGIIAPLLGGWALVTLGPAVAFGVTAGVQMLSALPLLGAPQVAVADTAPGAIRASMMGFALFAADGWTGSGLYFVWPITLFVTLGKSFAAFGGAMALAALAGAAAGLLLGRHIDAGHGRRAVWVAFAVLAITILARAGATTPAMALTANALGALVPCLYTPTLMTAVYNLAQGSPCALRFHMVTEGAYDLGCGLGCLSAAALLALGASLPVALLLALAGAMTSLILLRRYYTGLPEIAVAA